MKNNLHTLCSLFILLFSTLILSSQNLNIENNLIFDEVENQSISDKIDLDDKFFEINFQNHIKNIDDILLHNAMNTNKSLLSEKWKNHINTTTEKLYTEDCQLDSTYVYSSNGNPDIPFEKIYFYYDESGNLIKAVSIQHEPIYQAFYTYKDGVISSELHQISNGIDWYNWALIDYKYTNSNNLIDSIYFSYYDYNNDEWAIWKKVRFEYNDLSLPITQYIYYSGEHGTFNLLSRINIYYDDDLRLKKDIKQNICFSASGNGWLNSLQKEFTYNEENRLKEILTSSWNIDYWTGNGLKKIRYAEDDLHSVETIFEIQPAGDYLWKKWKHDVVTYNQLENQIFTTTASWGNQNWVKQVFKDSVFNEAGQILEVVVYTSICEGVLNPISKMTFNYNNSELLEQKTNYSILDNNWRANYRRNYTYAANGNLITETHQSRSNNIEQWNNIYKYDYSYDSLSMQLVEKNENLWYNEQWNLSGLIDFSYNDLNSPLEEMYSYWDNSEQNWELYKKIVFTYNEFNQLIEKAEWQWKFDDGAWNWKPGFIRYLMEYNNIDKLNKKEIQYWNSLNQGWQPKYLLEYNYDVLTEKNIETTIFRYQQSSVIWQENMRLQNYCSELNTAIENAPVESVICTYKNPFPQGGEIFCNNYLSQGNSIKIFDMMGRLVYKNKFNSSIQINQPLGKGVFNLIIYENEKIIWRDKIVSH